MGKKTKEKIAYKKKNAFESCEVKADCDFDCCTNVKGKLSQILWESWKK